MCKKMRIFLRMSDFVHIFLIAYYHSILHSIISLFVRSSLVIDEEKDEYQFGICWKKFDSSLIYSQTKGTPLLTHIQAFVSKCVLEPIYTYIY